MNNRLYLYGDIIDTDQVAQYEESGEEYISPKSVRESLSKASGPVTIYLNTYGGSVFAATDIVAAMKSQVKEGVTVVVNGLAASAGSIIAMGASRIIMDDNSYLMLHKPYCTVEGNSDAMRKQADLLDKMQETIVNLYMSRVQDGVSRETIMSLIENETWLNASDTQKYFKVEIGSVDEAGTPVTSRVGMYASTPVRVAAKVRFFDRDEHDEEEQLPGPADVNEKKEHEDLKGDSPATESEEDISTDLQEVEEDISTDLQEVEEDPEKDLNTKSAAQDEEVCPKCDHDPCTCKEDEEKMRVRARVDAFRILLYETKEVI